MPDNHPEVHNHRGTMGGLPNPFASSFDDGAPPPRPGRWRRGWPLLPIIPTNQTSALETNDPADPTPGAQAPLLGCCLGRALLLAGAPAVDELPAGIREIARRALADTTDQPSGRKWRQVAAYLRHHHNTPESLFAVTGPPRPPLPQLRFLLARRDPTPASVRGGPESPPPPRPLRWVRDLPVLAWMAAHRVGDLVIADREPDLRMRRLLSHTHLIFDSPLLKHLT